MKKIKVKSKVPKDSQGNFIKIRTVNDITNDSDISQHTLPITFPQQSAKIVKQGD